MSHLKYILVLLMLWTGSLHAATYRYNGYSDLIGEIQYHRVQNHDSWESIGYYYDVGYLELRRAN